ncbi:MAG TPA: hypothetical protein IAB63_08855 [Candidatus Onthocola gallistercoris]|uniref:Uncharacterized protein n=1 Tax=Candidatus Onthocola gallistercoris TaxID=2840876 RepID=A0A9D1KXE2_9FIRM|nr:hypothetical protein [Candidatus Onthocola gallistercoris]
MQNDEKNLEIEEFEFSESYKGRKKELLDRKFGELYNEKTNGAKKDSCIIKDRKKQGR